MSVRPLHPTSRPQLHLWTRRERWVMLATAAATIALLSALVVAISPRVSHAADRHESLTFSGDDLVIANLIGHVEVTGHSGKGFLVDLQIHGRDADDAQPRVERVEGDVGRLLLHYPLERGRTFIYPELPGEGSCTFRIREHEERDEGEQSSEHHDWLDDLLSGFAGRKIEVRDHGTGLEMWADLRVQVPKGGHLDVDLGVGRIEARNADGELRLALKSGPARAEQVSGKLWIDTGAGAVAVAGAKGRVSVDTGAGSVDVTDVEGDVSIDTGSGEVSANGCRGDKLVVDTGSGEVRLTKVECRDVEVDTGSGEVSGEGIVAEDVAVDTGSGGVALQLQQLERGSVSVDTGSGEITLDLPTKVSAHVRASTGSGDVDVDVEGARVQRHERDEVELVAGSGTAQVSLETASGGIRIRQRGTSSSSSKGS